MNSRLRLLLFAIAASLSLLTGCATTSLNQSIQFGQTEKARQLIAEGRLIDEKDRLGNTPLHYAAQKGDRDLIGSLLNARADANAQNNDGESPLFLLLRKEGYYPDATALLLDCGADPNRPNKSGQTPLQFAADAVCYSLDYAAKTKVVRLLIEHGGDVNRVDTAGRTSLHFAASARPSKVLAIVADNAKNPNVLASPSGFNAYTFAVINGQRNNARLLAQRGVKPQLIASTDVVPDKTAPQPWEANQASKVNALAHDWYAAWLLEQGGPDSAAADRGFTTARQQYDLAVAEYTRARGQCAAEIPKAKSELARQKAGAVVRNILGTAVGLGMGMSTGTGFVVYSTGGFGSKPEYLEWLLGDYDREIAELKARAAVLRDPALLSSRALWSGLRQAEPHGKWRESVCMVTGYKVTMDGKPLDGHTTRDVEIKQAVDEFTDRLKAAGIFADVNPEDESVAKNQITLSITLIEKQDLHAGATVGKAMAVGFFTLGMFGNFTSGAYTYDTHIAVQLSRTGEQPVTFSADSNSTAEYSQNTAGAGAKAGKDTRTQVTRKALETLVAQIAEAAGVASAPGEVR
jgi:hypothetical protein